MSPHTQGNDALWTVDSEIPFCVTPVSLKENIFKWSFSFYQRLPTFLLTIADSTVNWGLWWLMGRIIPSSCGIQKEYLQWGQILACYFFLYWKIDCILLTIHIDLCGIYAKWDGWPAPRTTPETRRAESSSSHIVLFIRGRADKGTIWNMWETPTFESLTVIHSSGSNITEIIMIQKATDPGAPPHPVSTLATSV